jgi:ankyrin repeat protein
MEDRKLSVESVLIRLMDCYMLLESGSDDFDDSFDGITKIWSFMRHLADHVKTSQDLQSVKSWLSFLRKRNWHLDMQGRNGGTLLMFAAVPGGMRSLETVRLLLACGADVSLKNDFGLQALHYALLDADGDIPKFTEGNEMVNPERYKALVGVVTYLIEAGADIFALDNGGMTPMGCACSFDTLLAFADALESCGLSTEDTIEESNRREDQWEADRRRLYGAKRTAVDAEILQTPSTEGLHQRRRQICQPGDVD